MSEQDKEWLTKFNDKERETRVNLREIPSFYDDYAKKDKLDDIISIKVYYYHNDQLGTPNELTNQDGEVVWLADFEAWGRIAKEKYNAQRIGGIEIPPKELQPIRFQGQSFDSETGLHYNRFRYYDPDMGMFFSRDPIGLIGAYNVFQYAPNPTGWIDPLGLSGSAGNAIRAAGTAAAVDLAVPEPTDLFWPKLAVEAAVVAGAAAYEWSQSKAESDTCTNCKPCSPCKPYPKGTIGYQGPENHSRGIHAGKAHVHIFEVNQNPKTCKCFWNKGKKSTWGHQYFGEIKQTWINLNSSSERPPNYPH